jgi:hypothetical protein
VCDGRSSKKDFGGILPLIYVIITSAQHVLIMTCIGFTLSNEFHPQETNTYHSAGSDDSSSSSSSTDHSSSSSSDSSAPKVGAGDNKLVMESDSGEF